MHPPTVISTCGWNGKPAVAFQTIPKKSAFAAIRPLPRSFAGTVPLSSAAAPSLHVLSCRILASCEEFPRAQTAAERTRKKPKRVEPSLFCFPVQDARFFWLFSALFGYRRLLVAAPPRWELSPPISRWRTSSPLHQLRRESRRRDAAAPWKNHVLLISTFSQKPSRPPMKTSRLLLVFSALLLPACAKRQTPVAEGIRTQTFLVGNRSFTTSDGVRLHYLVGGGQCCRASIGPCFLSALRQCAPMLRPCARSCRGPKSPSSPMPGMHSLSTTQLDSTAYWKRLRPRYPDSSLCAPHP